MYTSGAHDEYVNDAYTAYPNDIYTGPSNNPYLGYQSTKTDKLKIAIIHFPFRGLTGSDRLIIDMALSFKSKRHVVNVFTTDLDKKGASFSEEKEINIISVNTHIVDTIYGLGIQCFYFLRSIILVLCTFGQLLSHDLIICDQLPTTLLFLFMILKLTFRSNDKRPTLVYYCHFPEFGYKGYLKKGPIVRAYRTVFNAIEKTAMSCVDVIYANSSFTKSVLLREYPECKRVKVLYPGIPETISNVEFSNEFFARNPICETLRSTNTLCSINRISGSKRLERVIFLAKALKRQPRLFTTVIAGGIGNRGSGGWEYLDTLMTLCKRQSLSFMVAQANNIICSSSSPLFPPFSRGEPWNGDADILFLLDATSDQRDFILAHSRALFYSSSREHFGMALPEGMLSLCLAIGMGSGGPLEIIEHKTSGYLIPDYPDDGEDHTNESLSPPGELIEMLERLYESRNVDPKTIPHDLLTIIQNGFCRAKSHYTIDVFTRTILADHEARLSRTHASSAH